VRPWWESRRRWEERGWKRRRSWWAAACEDHAVVEGDGGFVNRFPAIRSPRKEDSYLLLRPSTFCVATGEDEDDDAGERGENCVSDAIGCERGGGLGEEERSDAAS
jgi:hypothetical protein